jgi:hypothetical protein
MPVANLRLLLLGVRTVREIAVQKSSASRSRCAKVFNGRNAHQPVLRIRRPTVAASLYFYRESTANSSSIPLLTLIDCTAMSFLWLAVAFFLVCRIEGQCFQNPMDFNGHVYAISSNRHSWGSIPPCDYNGQQGYIATITSIGIL